MNTSKRMFTMLKAPKEARKSDIPSALSEGLRRRSGRRGGAPTTGETKRVDDEVNKYPKSSAAASFLK